MPQWNYTYSAFVVDLTYSCGLSLVAVVSQSLPFLNSTGKSLYVVYAGYQDYFMSLYDSVLTPQQALLIVPDVVLGIEVLIEVRNKAG